MIKLVTINTRSANPENSIQGDPGQNSRRFHKIQGDTRERPNTEVFAYEIQSSHMLFFCLGCKTHFRSAILEQGLT